MLRKVVSLAIGICVVMSMMVSAFAVQTTNTILEDPLEIESRLNSALGEDTTLEFEYLGTQLVASASNDGTDTYEDMYAYSVRGTRSYIAMEDGIRIRTAPSTSAGILGLLYKGDVFYVAQTPIYENGFIYGQASHTQANAAGVTGWVYGDYFCDEEYC